MPLLLSRTHYSLLTAPASPQALCEEAVRLGLTHLVLTDTNALYGLYPFAQAARRVGLQAVFGCELVHRGRRLTLLAQDERGYGSLCSLLSAFHGVGPGRSANAASAAAFDLVRACERYAQGLWFVCGDPRLLPELSVRVPREQLLVALPPRGSVGGADGSRTVGGRGAARDTTGSGPSAASSQRGRKLPDPGCPWPRRMLRDIARDLDLRLCAIRDVWFAAPQDHALHQLFLAVKWNRSLRGGDPAKDLRGIGVASPDAHLPSKEQLRAGHEEEADADAVAMAQQVLASCTLSFVDRAKPIFPPVTLPPGETAEAALRQLVLAGLRQRYGKPEQDAMARCEHELSVIESMGFAPYFLAVHQIVELARARDIPFVGRGSAADSLVAHCLGLTDADPLRYGLLFERFLNPGRSDLPDIDLDFCWRRRDELIEAVYEHFGRDHVAMIATYNTCGPRSAYQEAAKVIGLPPAEAVRRSKRLPWHGKADLDLAEIAAETPGFWREGQRGGNPTGGRATASNSIGNRAASSVHDSKHLPPEREQLLLSLAQQLLSAPRHLGVHPGGLVITPQPVATYAPLERAAKGVVVTQYDMHFVEGLGMVKIDLLGNRALSIVHDCVTMLQGHGVVVPDLQTIPEDDARTAKLLSSGGTLGCFQVESPAMRTLLQQMGATTMDRVIQAVALVRPGPAAAGMKDAFIRRTWFGAGDYGASALERSVRRHLWHHALPRRRDPCCDGGGWSRRDRGRCVAAGSRQAWPQPCPARRSGCVRCCWVATRLAARRHRASLERDGALCGLFVLQGALGDLRPTGIPLCVLEGALAGGLPGGDVAQRGWLLCSGCLRRRSEAPRRRVASPVCARRRRRTRIAASDGDSHRFVERAWFG